MVHHTHTYRLGLNVDKIKFNPCGSCEPSGLYFTNFENLGSFYEYGSLVAIIKIPIDAMVKYDGEDKWKADSFIIEQIDFGLIEYFV